MRGHCSKRASTMTLMKMTRKKKPSNFVVRFCSIVHLNEHEAPSIKHSCESQ